jgi:tRNA(Ile)-lysidine synthase
VTLDPAVAAVRLAVRRGLADLDDERADRPLLVACSGGADSLALLSATVFEARRSARHVVGVTVDHGLQEGSAGHADRVVAHMAALGADETVAVRVQVDAAGLGVEAAAREARYAVLEEVADRSGSGVVLLGHTLDDQAETVLLGLTRGSGGRSLAGMRPAFGPFRRPLLSITRAQTEEACRAEGIEFWRDPHNDDPRFTRSRVRHRVLPVLEEELGPGIAAALARTADSLRPDMEALDELAERLYAEARLDDGLDAGLDLGRLAGRPVALVTRVLRLAALAAGSPGSELFRVHVTGLLALLEGPASGELHLPGHLTAYRTGDHLGFRRTAVES